MSRRRTNKKNARSSVELAMNAPSAVAVAARLRTGAGSHDPHGSRQRRRDRRASRQSLRSGAWG